MEMGSAQIQHGVSEVGDLFAVSVEETTGDAGNKFVSGLEERTHFL